ncbi:MAG TPA: sugar phosphate isomerase/epimerase [Phycisphaerae bacterium]|nr:sugar phosphate isomerase/epimerase [Phycisphaerae bacterium]
MFDLQKNLGVQSYCFRGFKALPDLIAQIQAIGVTRTEVCAVHVDFNDEGTFDAAISPFRDAGLRISSIGVQTFRGDPAEEKWFRFAKAAGCRLIASNFDLKVAPAAIAAAEKLAEKYDMLLGIHNHGGYHWLGSLDMVTHILSTAGPRIGLCLDTAWAMQTGEDALKWAEKLQSKLFGIHVKDFTFDRTGKWHDVVVGTGNLKLEEVLALAAAAPQMAAITLEYEGDVHNPGPALRQCVDTLRRIAY